MAAIATSSVGSNDIEKAKRFYDEVLATIGFTETMPHPSGGRVYGSPEGGARFIVLRAFNGEPAQPGNGTMVGFQCDSREQAKAMYDKALALGGSDEGAPGPRGGEDSPFYGAYFRDLDGNKLLAFHYGAA